MQAQAPKFRHGQDAGKIALAFWLLVAPWMLNYSQAPVAVWNGDAVAIVVVVSSIAAMLKFNKWEEWICIVAGLWLMASPLILDYTALLPPTGTPPFLEIHATQSVLPASANHLGVGLAFIILSFWELNLWEKCVINSEQTSISFYAAVLTNTKKNNSVNNNALNCKIDFTLRQFRISERHIAGELIPPSFNSCKEIFVDLRRPTLSLILLRVPIEGTF